MNFEKKSKNAFTIIEIVLVISVIALIGGLVITNFDSLMSAFSNQNPEKPFFETVEEARIQAISRGETVFLKIVDQQCQVVSSQQEVLFSAPLEAGQVDFYAYLPIKGLSGTRPELDKTPLFALPFGKDGTSPFVHVKLKIDKELFEFDLDPFSSNKIETVE